MSKTERIANYVDLWAFKPLKMNIGSDECFHAGNRVALVVEYENEAGEPCEETVAEIWPAPQDIDIKQGERIVRAWNSHTALVEALEMALRHIPSNAMEYSHGDHGDRVYAVDVVRAALKAAKGE